jgi:hypothetical protein
VGKHFLKIILRRICRPVPGYRPLSLLGVECRIMCCLLKLVRPGWRLAVQLAMGWMLMALPACNGTIADAMQSGDVIAMGGLNGRWFGPVAPTVDGCTATSTGLMSVGGGTFAFDPFEGTTILDGMVGPGGTLEGHYSRQVGGQAPVSISFSGSATPNEGGGETIHGRLVSGRCSWSVTLNRG